MANICIVLALALIAVVIAAPQSAYQQPRQFVPAPQNFGPDAKPSTTNEESKDLQGAASYGYGSYGLYSPYTSYSLGYYGGYPYQSSYYGGYGHGYSSPYYYNKGYSGLYGGYWY